MSQSENTSGFSTLGIAAGLLQVLTSHAFVTPTPIQELAIPVAVTGTDVIGLAQTGTGKTLAFGVPLVQRLAESGGKALIVLPTRELALQVDETLQKLARPLGLRTVVLIGGMPIFRQERDLTRNPDIFVVTPGRLIDHLSQGTVKLDGVKVLVLDEADRMFDMGFAPQIKRIIEAVPKDRQTMMFSATMPQEIETLARLAMRNPERLEVARQGTATELVTQELYVVGRDEKLPLLEKLLQQYTGTVLVFSRTKHGAKRLTRQLISAGYPSAEIHSNRSLAQRKDALQGFKTGTYRVLVATDIAARGIDVSGIQLVVNFDLPDVAEDYVHRIGRTGRAGLTGHAVAFATPDQGHEVNEIEHLMRIKLVRASGFDMQLIELNKRDRKRLADADKQQERRERSIEQPQRPGHTHDRRPYAPSQGQSQAPAQPRDPNRPQTAPQGERRAYGDRPPRRDQQQSSAYSRPPQHADARTQRPDSRSQSEGSEGQPRPNDASAPSLQSNPKGFNGPRRAKKDFRPRGR
jgi:ATP-dependent RNA helicase RhlE